MIYGILQFNKIFKTNSYSLCTIIKQEDPNLSRNYPEKRGLKLYSPYWASVSQLHNSEAYEYTNCKLEFIYE